MLIFEFKQRRKNMSWLFCLSVLMLLVILLSLCAGEQWILPGDWLSPLGELFTKILSQRIGRGEKCLVKFKFSSSIGI